MAWLCRPEVFWNVDYHAKTTQCFQKQHMRLSFRTSNRIQRGLFHLKNLSVFRMPIPLGKNPPSQRLRRVGIPVWPKEACAEFPRNGKLSGIALFGRCGGSFLSKVFLIRHSKFSF